MEIRYSVSPEQAKRMTTEEMRNEFLIDTLFVPGEIEFVYSHVDRMITGSAVPTTAPIALEGGKQLGTDYFLERREMGVINIGGAGFITLDGEKIEMGPREGLYIGKETKEVIFESVDAENPAKFYLNSTPAHHKYPNHKIGVNDTNPNKLGAPETSNERTIYQYIHPAVCQSCQLLMGLTMLEPNNMWNTMPSHTHERRMEVYLYFDMPQDGAVFHMMGQPSETRHIVMRNEQAVISPSWSIHSGVGVQNYTCIWGMARENQTFWDMDTIPMNELN